MAFLIPDSEKNVDFYCDTSLIIKSKIIPDKAVASRSIAEWCLKGQPMKPNRLLGDNGRPRGIVVHNTEPISVNPSTTPAEQYTRATYPNCNMSGVIVHYYVDSYCAWQNLKLSEQGWHAADGSSRRSGHKGASYDKLGGNVDCIAVEIIGPDSEENGAKLVAYLMYVFDLTINDVYSHNYFMYGEDKMKPGVRKNCPIYILNHWDKFLDLVSEKLTRLTKRVDFELTEFNKDSNSNVEADDILYVVNYGHFDRKYLAEKALVDVKKKFCKDAFITSNTVNGVPDYRIQLGCFGSNQNAVEYCNLSTAYKFPAYITTKPKH